MKKFIVLYYMAGPALEKMQNSEPEEMKSEEQRWMDWFKNLGENLVEMGEYFQNGTRYDGSDFTEADGAVAGYSIIQAEDFEKAKELVSSHPHPQWSDGCSLELYEPMSSPDQS